MSLRSAGAGKPLSELTTLRLGGPAARLVEPRSDADLVSIARAVTEAGQPLYILAGGSNVVVADEGLPGVVMRVATRGILELPGADGRVRLEVAAGHEWDNFVRWCVRRHYAGIEALSGIPGSVGATPIQNVGAYQHSVGESIVEVRVLERRTGDILTMDRDSCRFDYRMSIFKAHPGRWIVLGVTFELETDSPTSILRSDEVAERLKVKPGDAAPLADIRRAVLAVRRGKGMLIGGENCNASSVGSFFVNPRLDERAFAELRGRVAARLGDDVAPSATKEPDGLIKVHAAWLIERAGFHRGYGDPDGIAVSERHALVLTNRGSGTTAKLMELARNIADTVYDRFGQLLVPEPAFLGVDW